MTQLRNRMNRLTALAALTVCAGAPACADVGAEDPQELASPELALWQNGKLWPKGQVPVCWSIATKPPGAAPLGKLTAAEKTRVQQIAANSWPVVANVDFTGWADCPSEAPKDKVELVIEDGEGGATESATGGLGWPGSGGRIRFFLATKRADFWDSFIPHELAHVLGFDHEQGRDGFPNLGGDCGPGTSKVGDTLGTPPDPQSITASTGYCTENAGLSHWDIVGAQNAYGARGDTSYLHFGLQTETALGLNNGAFEFEFSSNGDLLAIQKNKTTTQKTEVHVMTAESSYLEFGYEVATPLPMTTADTSFLIASNGDLYAIFRSGTGTRSTEVHVLSAASGWTEFSNETGTVLPETDGSWEFQLAENLDLFAFKKSATGTGSTEVHVLTAESNYQQYSLETGTALQETDSSWELLLAANRDVFAIRRTGTGTNSTEIHVLSAESGYQAFSLHTGTGLEESSRAQWDLALAPNRDLVGIKKNGRGIGYTELHQLAH